MNEGEILALVAGIIASVGAVLRGIAKDIAGALVAGAVAVLGFAAFLSNL